MFWPLSRPIAPHDRAEALELEVSAAQGEDAGLALSKLEGAVRMLKKTFQEAVDLSAEAGEAAAKCKVVNKVGRAEK